MQFRVTGANRMTGEDVTITLDAPTPSAAEQQANKLNLVVERVDVVSTETTRPHVPPVPLVPPAMLGLESERRGYDERTLCVEQPKMFRGDPGLFALYSLLVPVLGVGLVLLFCWWLECVGTLLTLTTERTIRRKGLLSKHTTEVRHVDVRNIQVHQDVLQRIFHTGKICISSAGQSNIEISVSGIRDPDKIRRLVDQHRGSVR